MTKINNYLAALLLLVLAACSGEDSESGDGSPEKPQITIVNPIDTINLSDSISVKVLYSDNTGLLFTEISLGTESGGNTVYHSSQRGLSGLDDELYFKALVPPIIDITGRNYILVKCEDEDGNQTISEKRFELINPDNNPPQFKNVYSNGVLSRNPNTVFEVAYEVEDDQALDRIEISFRAWDGQNLGAEFDGSSVALNGVTSYNNIWIAFGDPSYVPGDQFRVELKLYDKAGNESQMLLNPIYSIQ